MFTLTSGNDYFVLVFRSDTTNTQNNVFYRFIHKTIVFIFVNFVLIEMREKLRSQE